MKIKKIYNFLVEQFKSMILLNDSQIATTLRSKIYGTDTKVKTGVVIKETRNFDGASGSALYHGVEILNQNGCVRLGNNSHIGSYSVVNAVEGTVDIGNNVAVGPGTKIIAYSNSYGPGRLVTESRKVDDIQIGDNVFIGANTTILPGSRIYANTIVGAQSLVNGELDSNAIYAGAPCKKVSDNWY